jgi:hypothetical protein
LPQKAETSYGEKIVAELRTARMQENMLKCLKTLALRRGKTDVQKAAVLN